MKAKARVHNRVGDQGTVFTDEALEMAAEAMRRRGTVNLSCGYGQSPIEVPLISVSVDPEGISVVAEVPDWWEIQESPRKFSMGCSVEPPHCGICLPSLGNKAPSFGHSDKVQRGK